jgi:hypothetical protein
LLAVSQRNIFSVHDPLNIIGKSHTKQIFERKKNIFQKLFFFRFCGFREEKIQENDHYVTIAIIMEYLIKGKKDQYN